MPRITLVRPAYSAQIYSQVYAQDRETRREIRPPLGLMSLAGYLEPRGHTVHVIDGEPELLDVNATVERVLLTRPDFVGITSTTPEYPFAHHIITRIKALAPHVVTIFGGAHITNLPEHTIEDLGDAVDWGVLAEGEKPLAAVVEGRAEDLVWAAGSHPKLLMAPERLTGAELDEFFPSRTVLDMDSYRFVDTSVGLVQNDALETARGCPFSCAFCTSRKTLLAKRSLDVVMEEIIASTEHNGTRLFMFFDDTFTVHKARAIELFERITHAKRAGVLDANVHFYGFTRANTLDWDLMQMMKGAGCDKITLGIESGNAEILRGTRKGTELDDYRAAYAMIEEAGITKRGSFILGHPYETQETIRDSIDFALELDLDEVGVNIMTPYPGQLTFRDAYAGRGIWLSHAIHYAELRNHACEPREGWRDFLSMSWHDYWCDHLRWGKAVIETEALSSQALVYWHSRFLQEVYGSDQMARRRKRFIASGNDDDYWQRPWRINAQRNRERIAREKREGEPRFPAPLHLCFKYDPVPLRDYQKNELVSKPGQRRRAAGGFDPA